MGKAFSLKLERLGSKKPLKYSPEDVIVIAVDMNQEQFDFAMECAKDALGKFKKEEEPAMAKHIADVRYCRLYLLFRTSNPLIACTNPVRQYAAR